MVFPAAPSLPLKPEGTSKLHSGVIGYKFICPKVKWEKNPSTGKYRRICHCEHPCTSSPCGRMAYIYSEKDLRAYPGTLRGTGEWDNTYKILTTVECSINHFKDSFGIDRRKTQNEKALPCRSASGRNHAIDRCHPCGSNQAASIYPELKTSNRIGLITSKRSLRCLL